MVELAKRLEEIGIEVWLDIWNLIPGEPYMPKIEEALAKSSAIAVFVGALGRSPYQNLEVQTAINTRARTGTRVIPVLLPGASEDQATGFLQIFTWVKFEQTLDEDNFQLLVCGIRGTPPRSDARRSEPATPWQGRNPYRGLAVFDVEDAPFFCGREEATKQAVAKLRDALPEGRGSRCLCIVGASGSGKSSLARAGVCYSMMQSDANWKPVIFTPGHEPLESLASAMLRFSGNAADGLALTQNIEALRKDERMLHRSVMAAMTQQPEARVLMLVDQFEELFTRSSKQEERQAFIANVLCAAEEAGGKLALIITLRADFYEECAPYPKLARVLSDQQVLVGPMTQDQLRAAITEPAGKVQCEVEPELTRLLLRDSEGQAGVLPLLQFVLLKMWNAKGSACKLTVAAYEQIGKLDGALNEDAEQAYALLSDRQKELCKRLFIRLVQPFQANRFAKQSVPIDELLGSDSPPEAVKTMEEVLGILAGPQARLITIAPAAAEKKVHVELAHEALISGWKRLQAWLNADREFLLWKQRLRVGIDDWRKTGKDEGSHLTGALLDQATSWLKQRPDDHSGEEKQFIEDSRRCRIAAKRRRYLMFLAPVTVSAILVTAVIVWEKRSSERARMITNARTLLAAEPALGLVLAAEAAKEHHTPQTEALLQEAVQAAGAPMLQNLTAGNAGNNRFNDVAFTRDGRYVATAGNNGSAQIWDAGTSGASSSFDMNSPVERVAWSRDDQLLAAGASDGVVKLWRVKSGQAGGAPAGSDASEALGPQKLPGKIKALAVKPDKPEVFAATADYKIFRIAAATAPIMLAALTDHINDLALSPDGGWLAAACNDLTVRLWRLASGEVRAIAHPGPVQYVAFTGDGKRLVSATIDGEALIWDVDSGKQLCRLQPPGRNVIQAAASADGARVATQNADRSLSIWDANSCKEQATFQKQDESITKLALNGDGSRLAAATRAGVRIYELNFAKLNERAQNILHDVKRSDLANCYRYLKPSKCAVYQDAAHQ